MTILTKDAFGEGISGIAAREEVISVARDSAAVSRIRLVQEATRILRKQGYTWAGRKRNAISSGQVAFEKRLVLTPCGGRADRR